MKKHLLTLSCLLATATLYAAYTDRAFLSAKVRSFIDFLCEKTAQDTEAV